VSGTALVVFLGGFGGSPAERLVDGARLQASLDAVAAWREATGAAAIIATDTATTFEAMPLPEGVTVDADPRPFHFGRRLAGLIRNHALGAVVCLGGGALPLLAAADFNSIGRRLDRGEAVTNNLFSSDLTAFPATAATVAVLESVNRDNSLARALREDAGLVVEKLPATLETRFDLDTPTDIASLAVALGAGAVRPGPRLADFVEGAEINAGRYRSVLPLLTERTAQVVVAGRIGANTWAYLETETACRVRVFAEERGMEADERSARGEVHSLLGYHLEAVGVARFFSTLAELGDAVFLDSRVILAHRRLEPSRADRFLSDLGEPSGIADQFLREFTEAALAAPVPVLLGGHSLMSGDLMLLNDAAWALAERGN
jgi:hypothetical protein